MKEEEWAVLGKEILEGSHKLEIFEEFLHQQSHHFQHWKQLFFRIDLVAYFFLNKRSHLHLQIGIGLFDLSIAEGRQVVEEEGADHDPGGSSDWLWTSVEGDNQFIGDNLEALGFHVEGYVFKEVADFMDVLRVDFYVLFNSFEVGDEQFCVQFGEGRVELYQRFV